MAKLRMGYLLKRGRNLSDLIDKDAARLNLGLGSAATKVDTRYAHRAENLNDLDNAGTARNNLGLGSAATENVGSGNGLDADSVDGLQGSQLLRNDVSAGAISTYILARDSSETGYNSGEVCPGSVLYPCNAEGRANYSEQLAGSWRAMGYTEPSTTGERTATVWMRIA